MARVDFEDDRTQFDDLVALHTASVSAISSSGVRSPFGSSDVCVASWPCSLSSLARAREAGRRRGTSRSADVDRMLHARGEGAELQSGEDGLTVQVRVIVEELLSRHA